MATVLFTQHLYRRTFVFHHEHILWIHCCIEVIGNTCSFTKHSQQQSKTVSVYNHLYLAVTVCFIFDNIGCRYIPDDMTFDQEVRSTARDVPSNYTPSLFVTTALQQSAVSTSLSCDH